MVEKKETISDNIILSVQFNSVGQVKFESKIPLVEACKMLSALLISLIFQDKNPSSIIKP